MAKKCNGKKSKLGFGSKKATKKPTTKSTPRGHRRNVYKK